MNRTIKIILSLLSCLLLLIICCIGIYLTLEIHIAFVPLIVVGGFGVIASFGFTMFLLSTGFDDL